MAEMKKKVHVRVPASTANIGPGFDVLGCALSLYADFTCERINSGLEITGCPKEFQNKRNLFVRAFRLAEFCMGVDPMPIRVDIHTDVPVSRGLGSSATLLAGGVVAANALHGGWLSRKMLVKLCNDIEGHPDNVAPAVLGGMCASLIRDAVPVSVPIRVAENVGFIAAIPNYETETKAMRSVLPREVTMQDAVFNASHLAVMMHAFEEGDMNLIAEALDDRLHQPFRKKLIHEYERVESVALEAGCAAFCISGSGSTCLGVCEASESAQIAEQIQQSVSGSQYEWKVLPLSIDRSGATIIE